MKKVGLIFSLLLLATIFSLSTHSVSAALPTDTLTDNVNKLNENMDDLPTDPDALRQVIRDRYLKAEWNDVISRNKYIGPFYRSCLANQWLFQIFFHENFSFSLVFILTVILWFFFLFIAKIAFKPFFKDWYFPWILGMLLATAFAWVGLTKSIINIVLTMIYGQNMWWARLLLWVIAFLLMVLITYFDNIFAQLMRRSRRDAENASTQARLEELEARNRGKDMAMDRGL